MSETVTTFELTPRLPFHEESRQNAATRSPDTAPAGSIAFASQALLSVMIRWSAGNSSRVKIEL